MSGKTKTKTKMPRSVQILIVVLVIALVASLMTSILTPLSSVKSSSGSSGIKDNEIVYIPVPSFGGRNVGSYEGPFSMPIVGDNHSLGVRTTELVSIKDIDYFSIDFSIELKGFVSDPLYFGFNPESCNSSPFYYRVSETVTPEGFGYNDRWYYFGEGLKYYEESETIAKRNLNITLIYRINHDDPKNVECKAYVDGEYVTTEIFSYSYLSHIEIFAIYCNVPYEGQLEYVEMNVFDKGYDGPLVEYYEDNTKNLADCTDAYMYYKNIT